MNIILSEILKDFKHKSEIQLRWKDIDQFGHVNNSNYLTFFEVARFNYCRDVCDWDWARDKFIIANISIDYLRPIFFPNKTFLYLRLYFYRTLNEFHYLLLLAEILYKFSH